jgi:DNA ligase (NAD+)
MNSSDSIRHLQAKTAELIKKQGAGKTLKTDIDSLREVLRFHEYRYYVLNDPLLADTEYDHLYKSLEKLEHANPGLITADPYPTCCWWFDKRLPAGTTPRPHVIT